MASEPFKSQVISVDLAKSQKWIMTCELKIIDIKLCPKGFYFYVKLNILNAFVHLTQNMLLNSWKYFQVMVLLWENIFVTVVGLSVYDQTLNKMQVIY